MIRHPQQGTGHRGVGLHVLAPPPRAALVRDPGTTHQLGLPDVQRRDPFDDLLGLLIYLQHRRLLARRHEQPAVARKDHKGEAESDPRARSNTEAPKSVVLSTLLTNDLRRSQATGVSGQPPPSSPRRHRLGSLPRVEHDLHRVLDHRPEPQRTRFSARNARPARATCADKRLATTAVRLGLAVDPATLDDGP